MLANKKLAPPESTSSRRTVNPPAPENSRICRYRKNDHDFIQNSCRGNASVGGDTDTSIRPGAFAFYYPNADVLNGGAPMPEARLASAPPAASEAYAARESGIAPSCGQRYRSCDPASGIFFGGSGSGCRFALR